MKLLDKICEIIHDILELDDEVSLTEETVMEDIDEWDSFGQVALVAELEHVFDISFTRDEIMEMNSVAGIKAVLNQKGLE